MIWQVWCLPPDKVKLFITKFGCKTFAPSSVLSFDDNQLLGSKSLVCLTRFIQSCLRYIQILGKITLSRCLRRRVGWNYPAFIYSESNDLLRSFSSFVLLIPLRPPWNYLGEEEKRTWYQLSGMKS